jgi:hypothetical protein
MSVRRSFDGRDKNVDSLRRAVLFAVKLLMENNKSSGDQRLASSWRRFLLSLLDSFIMQRHECAKGQEGAAQRSIESPSSSNAPSVSRIEFTFLCRSHLNTHSSANHVQSPSKLRLCRQWHEGMADNEKRRVSGRRKRFVIFPNAHCRRIKLFWAGNKWSKQQQRRTKGDEGTRKQDKRHEIWMEIPEPPSSTSWAGEIPSHSMILQSLKLMGTRRVDGGGKTSTSLKALQVQHNFHPFDPLATLKKVLHLLGTIAQ